MSKYKSYLRLHSLNLNRPNRFGIKRYNLLMMKLNSTPTKSRQKWPESSIVH